MSRKKKSAKGKADPGRADRGRKGGKGPSEGGRPDRRRAESTRVETVEEPSWPRRVWDQVGPILLAVIIALGIRAMIVESYYVPSGSMLPTMFIGDHVFVSKFTFGAHVPFTGWTLPAVRDPERGEIVVFALGRGPDGICPADECPDYPSEGFVKRIAAVPGDTVEYRNGVLILNGEPAPQTPLEEPFPTERGDARRLLEDLDGCRHEILEFPGASPKQMGPITVPEDRYFMLGDNRDNSNDSRFWGTVHRDDLKGPVLFNYWAWNNRESWPAMLNPFTWVRLLWSEMYWDRFGMTYECREDG